MRLKFKTKLSALAIIRYVKLATTGSMLVALLWVGAFLYDNFYHPLTQAAIVAEMKTRIALATVDRRALETVIANTTKRRAGVSIEWASLPDPFVIVSNF